MATYSIYANDGGNLYPVAGSSQYSVSRIHAVVNEASEGGTINTPAKFTVGSHQVKVFLNGLLIPEGIGFTENSDGTSVEILYSLTVGDEIDIEVSTATSLTVVVQRDSSRDAVMAAGTSYTVPEHKVGINHLTVYLDGMCALEGITYTDASTTTITFTNDIPIDMEIIVYAITD